jgi:ABC-type transport system involved in multi-copper enzyme maturation permease subunit
MTGELTRQELLKLASQRYPYVLLAIALAAQAAAMLVLGLRRPESSLDVLTGAQLWSEGALAGLRLSAYIVLVTGAMSLSGEFSQGTAKTWLVLPLTRRHWLAGKLLSLLALSAALVAAVAALAWLVTAFTAGWGDVAREGITLHRAAEVQRHLALSVALTVLLMAPVCAFGMLVGLLFPSPGAAVAVAVLLGTTLDAAANLFDSMGRFIFFAYLTQPFATVGRIGKGMAYQWQPVLTWGLGVSAATLLVLLAVLFVRLEKMDIPG